MLTRSRPLSLRLYAAAAGAAHPLLPLWLARRRRRGKEDPLRWRERLGVTDAVRPPGRLAWLHGASVGEAVSLLPLVEGLRAARPDAAVLVTSGTRASAEVLRSRLGPGALHQFAPLDTPAAARRFLDHWRPDLAVFAESELWPNLILAARARGVRLALVSARLSASSAAGWGRAPAAAHAVLGAFDLVLARDGRAAADLAALGARVAGEADLKFGARPLPVDEAALAAARTQAAGRPVILAASTHPGEERVALAAFASARGEGRALLVLAPRHPERGEAVAALVRQAGLGVSLRSSGGELGAAPVHVADTVGEMGLWYRFATLSLIGGSFGEVDVGGHNPLEPARVGAAFISGPNVGAWPVYQALAAAGVVACVPPADFAARFARAIDDPASLAEVAARARAWVAAGDAAAGEAVARIVALAPA